MPETFISAVKGYLRLKNFPLDASSVYDSFLAASQYASTNPTAYAGQLVAVVEGRTVTVYQLGFKLNEAESGFELQPLSTEGGSGPIVRTVNGAEPDDNGNIEIDFSTFEGVFDFFTNTPERVIFNKPISIQIENSGVTSNDVINKQYLDATLEDVLNGNIRTIKTTFNYTGGTTQQIIPGGSVIKKTNFKIIEPFEEGAVITVRIDTLVLYTSDDIFETQPGSYITEPFLTIPGELLDEYPIAIEIFGSSVGSAELYIDLNTNFL
jgi:hypothetical protein